MATSDKDLQRRDWRICGTALLVAVASFLPYFNCGGFQFVEWDDGAYVFRNPMVLNGLSPEGLTYAWTTFDLGNWIPLTWMSLQLDASLWGTGPVGFHVTNAVLHALAAGVLYTALTRMTGSSGLSLVAALLFGAHPLRVESVAWVAERKDVLSVLFGTISLWCYARFVVRQSRWWMLGVLAATTLSLLAKPMLVTLPACLVLLDFWPLNRVRGSGWKWILVEKLPLIILAAAATFMTMQAQSAADALFSSADFPLETRTANAVLSTTAYLAQTFWPFDLAAFYPHQQPHWYEPRVVASAMGLAAITALCAWQWRRQPYLIVGWLWFLGTLAPVLGILVQFGSQARADRYTYWPHIGLLTGIVWGAHAALKQLRVPGRLAATAAAIMVVGLMWTSSVQSQVWRDTYSMWKSTVRVTGKNALASTQLGFALMQDRRYDEAAVELRRALDENDPRDLYPQTYYNLGVSLFELGRYAEAEAVYRQLLQRSPAHSGGWAGLGWVSLRAQRFSEARGHFLRALQSDPQNIKAQQGLESLQKGKPNTSASTTPSRRFALSPQRV